MIAIIRIRGQTKLESKAKETLVRLRLRKKYSCVVLKENPVTKGMIKKVKDLVAYGEINEETFTKLIEARGKKIDSLKKNRCKKNLGRN